MSGQPSTRYWLHLRRTGHSLLLAAIFIGALLLRLPGIEWGLPPVTPQVLNSGWRCSYAFDECQILKGAAKADIRHLNFDPHEYHWGTLHIELVLLTLDAAQAAGFFPTPWRVAYSNLVDGDFVRVYLVARLVAVAMALLTIWLLLCFEGEWAGPFAAMLVAVSASHVLQSDQVRVDVTMTAMLVLTLLVGIRIQRKQNQTARQMGKQFLLLGIAAGLAIAGKYSAVSAVGAIVLTTLWLKRFPWRGILTTAAGTALGFVCGSPYIFTKLARTPSFYSGVGKLYPKHSIPAEFAIPVGRLMELHAVNLVRFSMGLPAVLLAVVGIVWMLRRRSASDWLILAATAAYIPILIPLRWPMIRYDIPLVALLGLCAGVALEQLSGRWRYCLTAAALIMPLGGSIAQVHYMRLPHPANLMLASILDTVPPGTPIARLVPDVPPLDEQVYPMELNVLTDDLTRNPPPWALLTDLAADPIPRSNMALLHDHYDEVAHFESRRILGWATFGENFAPQDWMYTHCSFTLYRRKAH